MSHEAGGSDPGMHPDPIYQFSIQVDSSSGRNNQHRIAPSKIC